MHNYQQTCSSNIKKMFKKTLSKKKNLVKNNYLEQNKQMPEKRRETLVVILKTGQNPLVKDETTQLNNHQPPLEMSKLWNFLQARLLIKVT